MFRAVGLFRAVVTGPFKRGLFSGGGGLFRGLFRAGRECSSGMFFGEMFSGNVLRGKSGMLVYNLNEPGFSPFL